MKRMQMNVPYMLAKTMELVKTPMEVLHVTVVAVLEDRAAMKTLMSACHLLVETTVSVLTHTEGLCVFVCTVSMEIYVKQDPVVT